MIKEDKRINKPSTEDDLYKIPNLKQAIFNERRKDEKDRLKEIRQQKNIGRNIIVLSAIMNVLLIAFALVGYAYNV
tara:strand:+ start:453 stop:680 length:228 start_codon:yes stop_codon:yes gene_type:complete